MGSSGFQSRAEGPHVMSSPVVNYCTAKPWALLPPAAWVLCHEYSIMPKSLLPACDLAACRHSAPVTATEAAVNLTCCRSL